MASTCASRTVPEANDEGRGRHVMLSHLPRCYRLRSCCWFYHLVCDHSQALLSLAIHTSCCLPRDRVVESLSILPDATKMAEHVGMHWASRDLIWRRPLVM